MASVGGAACMESGTVANATEQSIYATQSGQVASLPIQAGTAVTAGQTVMTIENASLTNAVTNAALSVESARVSLTQLEDSLSDYTVTAPVDGTVLTRTCSMLFIALRYGCESERKRQEKPTTRRYSAPAAIMSGSSV